MVPCYKSVGLSISTSALVAELVDAQVSGTCVRKDVGVRVPFRAPSLIIVPALEKSVKTLYSGGMTIYLHKGDLPSGLSFPNGAAIDSETMGLNLLRDRLCLIQVSAGDGDAHLVQFDNGRYEAPRLKALLEDKSIEKIFHFARFDLAACMIYLGVDCSRIYCTKTASRLARTFTDRHSLRELCRDLLGVDLNKQQQSSDWGADTLTEDQKTYAANDVLYLHQLRDKLDAMLVREGRTEMARAVFDFLPVRAALDLEGWAELDIFAH